MVNTLAANSASTVQNRSKLSSEQKNAMVVLFPDIATLTDDDQRNKFLNNMQNFATGEIRNIRKENDKQAEDVLEKTKNDAEKMEEFQEERQSYKANNQAKIAELQKKLDALNKENDILSINEGGPLVQFKYATVFNRQSKKLERFENGIAGAQAAMRYAYYGSYPPGVRHLARALNKSGLPFTRENPKKVAERFEKMIAKIESKATTDRQRVVAKRLRARYESVYSTYAKDYNKDRVIQQTLSQK